MRLIFTKSKWEMWDDPLASFLTRARADGFDAVEIYLPAQPEPASEIRERVADCGLLLVAQINTEGGTPAEHEEALRARFARAAETEPLLVNSHTGRDIFSFEENRRLFETGVELARDHGLPLAHETHRSRPTSSGPETRRYLESVPAMRLTADFSHSARPWPAVCMPHRLSRRHEDVDRIVR